MSRKTVLVVEDEADLRTLYRVALRSAGFDVLEADDGLQALRILESSSADVVVLDLFLPMLDGVSVLEELAAHSDTRGIPIIVVTGTQISAKRLRACEVLLKPIDPDELIAAVRDCLKL